jgi:hypothetical protein
MNEEAAIQSYMELTGATEATARSVFMMVCLRENFESDTEGDQFGAVAPKQYAESLQGESRNANAAPRLRSWNLDSKFGPAFDNQRAAMNWART